MTWNKRTTWEMESCGHKAFIVKNKYEEFYRLIIGHRTVEFGIGYTTLESFVDNNGVRRTIDYSDKLKSLTEAKQKAKEWLKGTENKG